MSSESRLTVEEVPPGRLPSWIYDHAVNQARESILSPTFDRILYIHPNQASRVEMLDFIQSKVSAFDRSLHHTINSLTIQIGTNLNLKPRMENDSILSELIHIMTAKAAMNLRFPVLHPIEDSTWNRSKTEALFKLHKTLTEEDTIADSEEHSHAREFRKILEDISNKMGRTHPDIFTASVIHELTKDDIETPFFFEGIKGVLTLDHDPGLSNLNITLLRSLLRFLPIHQITNSGSYRLGEHGLQIEDIFPITDQNQIPDWIPSHSLVYQPDEPNIEHYALEMEKQTMIAVSNICETAKKENPDASILIIDPDWKSRALGWRRCIESVSSLVSPELEITGKKHIMRSFSTLISLASGMRSFSVEKIRQVSNDGLFERILVSEPHPSNPNLTPTCHLDLLEEHARNHHITGGQGAIRDWLETISLSKESSRDADRWEELQWWMSNLFKSLYPMLPKWDREYLDNQDFVIGCATGKELPFNVKCGNGKKWLDEFFRKLTATQSESITTEQDEEVKQKTQHLKTRIQEFYTSLSRLNLKIQNVGPLWVETLLRIIEIDNSRPIQIEDSNLRILSPKEALGCTADHVIMTHLSSTSWSMRPSMVPLLSSDELYKLKSTNPESPVLSARHFWHHLLHSGNKISVIRAKDSDVSAPSSLILEEWLDSENSPESRDLQDSVLQSSPRERLRADGKRLIQGEKATKKPLSPLAPYSKISRELFLDMQYRMPIFAGGDGYLTEDSLHKLIQAPPLGYKEIKESDSEQYGLKNPRENNRWPVVGAKTRQINEKGKEIIIETPSIDPCPITPWKSDIEQHDSRHGHTTISIERDYWSPSSLMNWKGCPRRAWLANHHKISEEEITEQDLDSRVYGTLLHDVHHDILNEALGVEIGIEKGTRDSSMSFSTLSDGKLNKNQLMMIGLKHLSKRATWISRSDAVAIQRLWMLTGMSHSEWISWLSDPKPIEPSGRIGSIIDAELNDLNCSAPISTEWKTLISKKPLTIDIPREYSGGKVEHNPSFSVRGQIDRVDIIPFDIESKKWVDQTGSNETAPLRIHGTDWKPRRLIIIRDLKTYSGSKKLEERHKKGFFEDLQLPIYARAWEIAHPGDLVVGAGISVMGYQTKHFIEKSDYFPFNEKNGFGKETTYAEKMFRFHDEDHQSESDPFRAWMTHRLVVAGGIIGHANSGYVNPMPSRECRYCEIRNMCDQKQIGGF